MIEPIIKLDRKLGVKIFKNRSGLSGNISGRLNLWICSLLSDEEKKIHEDDSGIIEFDETINEEKVEELGKGLEDAIEDEEHREYTENGKTIKKFYSMLEENFSERMGALEPILKDLKPQIENFYGSHFEPVYVYAIRYPEDQDSDFNTRSWHLDEYSPDHRRIFLLLSDVEKSGGSSCFITRSDTRKAIGQVEGNFKRDNDFWKQWDKNYFYGEKGSLALANPIQHFHRGENPDDYRDMIIITLRPSITPLDDNWMEDIDHISTEEDLIEFSSLIATLKRIFKLN